MLHKKSQNVHKERYTWACSWTWRHNAALLQTVGCHKRSGTASVEKRKKLEEWMPPWYDSDDWKSQISNVFFWTLEEQNRATVQAKRKFSLLSHTPANRNECPFCKHFLATPANTRILSFTLKNQNFKFVILTRAPSQPVAKFLHREVFIQRSFYTQKLFHTEVFTYPWICSEKHKEYISEAAGPHSIAFKCFQAHPAMTSRVK